MAQESHLVRNEPRGMEAAVSHPPMACSLSFADSSWRVTESSSILLLLLDSRCPPLHCPPSLKTYVQNLKTHKEVVLVLTKADLVEPAALQGWKDWVKEWWIRPVEVVSVMSYDLDFLKGT